MKKVLVLAVCLVFLSAVEVFAEFHEAHSFELGTEVLSIKNEYGSDVEKWKGNMYGLVGSYTYRNDDNYMFKGEGRFVYGELDFSSQSVGTLNGIDDYITEGRILIGKDFTVGLNSRVTPYIGGGRRYLNDDMAGGVTSTNTMGAERKIIYIYLPLGVEFTSDFTSLDRGWLVGGKVEFDMLIDGSDQFVTAKKIELEKKDNGGSYRISFRGVRKLDKMDLVIEPFLTYWDVKRSKSLTDSATDGERHTQSEEYGVRILVKF